MFRPSRCHYKKIKISSNKSPDVCPMFLNDLSKKATEAASLIVGEVSSIKHSRTLATGEQVFHVVCRERASRVTVTVNPNGHKAADEWRSGSRGSNYKICDLQHMTITKEEKVVR
jgi:hypothetical protein